METMALLELGDGAHARSLARGRAVLRGCCSFAYAWRPEVLTRWGATGTTHVVLDDITPSLALLVSRFLPEKQELSATVFCFA